MSESLPVNYVTSNDEFTILCNKWCDETAIAVDTEFMRTNTFYAKIGLLQIADRDSINLIDPLEIRDWDAFRQLLTNSSCLLVVHSAGEDLNLLLTHIGCLPKNLFDTQIAAAFLGLGFSLSYQALVELLVGITVEKGETRSDWLRRPLSANQLQYAANDVVYLLEIADNLKRSLQENGRLQWFESECNLLLETAQQVEDDGYWDTLYANVSNAWRLNDLELRYLKRLCLWREIESRDRNRPRSWIAKDNDLYSIARAAAKMNPLTSDAIRTIKVQETKFLARYANAFEEMLIEEGKKDAAIDRSILNYPMEGQDRKALKELQRVVEKTAQELAMAPELIGRKRQLLEIMKQYKLTGELVWQGNKDDWRKELLQVEFTELLSASC